MLTLTITFTKFHILKLWNPLFEKEKSNEIVDFKEYLFWHILFFEILKFFNVKSANFYSCLWLFSIGLECFANIFPIQFEIIIWYTKLWATFLKTSLKLVEECYKCRGIKIHFTLWWDDNFLRNSLYFNLQLRSLQKFHIQ